MDATCFTQIALNTQNGGHRFQRFQETLAFPFKIRVW